MKKSSLVLALLLFYFLPKAQTVNDNNLEKSISEIEDTSSATYINGQQVSTLKGRKQIGDAFANFLNNFETVYHINGQQTLTLNGDKASGTSYWAVTLIGTENGKKMKTSSGVYYHDDYILQNGHWLIAKRKATFAWQDKQELSE